jgi:FkbM family methyltransferase
MDPNQIRKKIGFKSNPKFTDVTGVHGENMLVDVNDHIGYRYYMYGYFDDIPYLICKSIGFDKILFIDVGANTGTVCIPIAMNKTKVIAIEPQLSQFGNLVTNTRRNNLSSVLCLPIALGNSSSQELLELNIQNGNSGSASAIANWNKGKSPTRIEVVPMYSFDNVVAPLINNLEISGLTTIMKIDVEGMELSVAQGAINFIRKFNPLIIFEHRPDLEPKGDISRLLLELDYNFYGIKAKRELIATNLDSTNFSNFDPKLKYENVVAFHKTCDLYSLLELR